MFYLSLILDYRARPELLASLITCLIVLTVSLFRVDLMRNRVAAVTIGVLFGSLFCSHPVIFLLAMCAFSLAIIIELTDIEISIKDVVTFITIVSMSAATAALTFLFTIFGHSPIEYFRGIGKQAAMVAARQDFGGFIQMYVFNRFVPGLGLLFVLIPLCIYYGLTFVRHHLLYRKLWISCFC